MGETQVAEGPLIKHVPGGYAEWRAKESGLPPARLRTSEGEWWGKLVGPTDTLDVDAGIGGDAGGDTGGDGGGGDIGVVSPDPNFIQPDPATDPINWDYYDDKKVEPYEGIPDYKLDWNTDTEIPKGFGWGTSDAALPYSGGLDAGSGFRFYDYPGMTDPPMIGPQLPAKPDDSLGTGFQDPIVIRHPRPLTGETIQNITGKPSLGGEKPFRFYDPKWNPDSFSNRVKGITTDVLGGVESMSDAILGKTQYDQYPRPPKEKALGRLLGKWKDLVEGKGEEGFLLWETQGVPSSLGDRTPFGPDVIDALKNLDKIIKNEHNIKTQEYGKLQVVAIMNMAKLIAMYGPIGAVPATAVTLAKDIMSGFKNAFADHPEFRGNPAQDLVHGTTWVLGQTLEKTYNATLRKLVDKVDGEKLKEKLSKLNIVEGMKTPDVPTGIKITYTPPKETRLSGRGGEPQMPIPDVPPLGRINPPQPDAKIPDPLEPVPEAPVIGRETSPIMIGQPQGQAPTGTVGGESPTQTLPTVEQLPPKTITGPLGDFPRGELPPDDRLTGDSKPEISQGDPLGGGITGQVTGEPVHEMTDEEARALGLLSEEKEELNRTIDAETMLKIRQQVGLERRQTQFKETGKFKDDAVNEAFTKGAYNWLEHGADNYTGDVDTDHLSNASAYADIDKAIGDLNYYYGGLADEIRGSAAYDNYSDRQDALDGVERDRQSAIAGYESQRSNIQDSEAKGEGLAEFTTQSAVGIYLNNPGITPEEAVKQAHNQAQNARDGITEDTREDSNLKSNNFWQNINEKITGQISNITRKTEDIKSASNTAKTEQDKAESEEAKGVTQAIKDKSDKLLAKNQAAAKAFTKEMKAFYEKLAETEPLLGAKGSADLAKLDVTGKIVYSGTDGGVVLVKDKDGKVVSYAYVDPADKKVIDETMGGWISEDDPYLSGKPTVVMDPETMVPGP